MKRKDLLNDHKILKRTAGKNLQTYNILYIIKSMVKGILDVCMDGEKCFIVRKVKKM